MAASVDAAQEEWPDIWIVIVFALIIGLLALATPIAVETLVNTVAFGRFLQPVVILSLMLGTVIGMAILAFYHPWLLGFDVMLLAMLAVIVGVLGRGAVRTSIKESKTKYHMAAWLEDLAGCPAVFRYDGSARFALERADHLISDYLNARTKHFRILMRQIVFALGMQALASTVLLGLGGWLVISGEMTLGQLVAAELIVAVIVGSFAKLGKKLESLYDVLASVDKLVASFDLPLERQDGLSSLSATGDHAVVLREVACLDARGQQAFNDLDLTIHPGDRVAITHQDESEASTLLELLFGLRTPSHGRVKLRGAEIREIRPRALRRHVSLVRDDEVFEGSVTDNVRIGRRHITTTDVRTVVSQVGLLDDLLGLPEQLDTHLKSTGYPLSPTQLWRLMLARACVGLPNLLLIDRALDVLPDHEAMTLLSWLCRPEQPWKLMLITGREELAALCNRRVQLRPTETKAVPDKEVRAP